MAKTVIKSYVWWTLAGLLLAVILIGGYFIWSKPSKFSLKVDGKKIASDNDSEVLPEKNISALSSTLTLFSQQLAPGFITSQPLVTDERLTLCSTVAKTGEAALVGKSLSDGLFVYLNKINTEFSGLGGQIPLSLDQRDDSGQLLKSVKHISQLLGQSQLFFSPMGDSIFEKAYTPLLQADKAAVVFPVVGIRPHTLENKPVVFLRPSYTQEVAALIHYALHVLKKKKIAVFYEESNWGRMGKEAVQKILKKENIKLCAYASYQPGSVSVSAALKHMNNAEPHVIICIASGRPAYNFIRQAVNQQLHYASFLGVSGLAGIADHLKKTRGIHLVTASVVPNPHNSQLPIVQEYRKDMQRYLANKSLSTYSLEGYINSAVLVYFLQQLTPLATIGDLMNVIQNSQDIDFKGLRLSFNDNALSQSVWINEGQEHSWHEFEVGNA